ncbi:MAG: helix-turn-helix domain-containing protein [Clostridia bacterium]|nr:helix-turn-helix domain-containing protein [Clostridia bacterium]MDE7328842.1 helix-turn-helix domain-containing protein [Clostridia bacterium]
MSKFPENSEMRTSKKFSERIKDSMEENDCETNKQFAELVGVSYPIITKAVDFGIIPTTKTLIKIADKLDLSLAYLLGMTDEKDFIGALQPSNFSTRIQSLAKERNETLGGIASKMPFSRTYFYMWIKKDTLPLIEYAIAIAEYFKVSLDYLFGRSDYRK